MARKTEQQHQIVTNITQVLENKAILNKYMFVISGENTFYDKGDKRIPAHELDSLYPTDLKVVRVKGNLIGKGNIAC